MSENQYSMYSHFDLKLHKKYEHNFEGLEVIVFPDGHVEYAMPSHIEKLISITGLHRDVIYSMMDVTDSPMRWLCEFTKCVSVWPQGWYGKVYTDEQKATLNTFIREGLIHGMEFNM